jgi:3-phenylpropionate/trans-cinnamate dioxygenase ferredoxin reductase subunit
MTSTDVVIGGGLAGAAAAASLREAGASTDIVIVSEEPDPPYERPELSKGYLAGKTDRAELDLHPAQWYAENEITLLSGRRAVAIHRDTAQVELDDGERIAYTRLLLATGSSPRQLGVPGDALGGVLALRRVADSEAIREAISAGGPLVLIGAGWIGLEVASVARSAGVEVTVLESGPAPLSRVLGAEIGQTFTALHRGHGVDVRTGVTVTALLGGSDGRVTGVQLDDGTVLPAAAVIVGVGIKPETGLAEAAGLAVDDGILVDATLRTADPAIWAAGDVANAENDWAGRRLRVEHFANAAEQGPFAGRSMAGSPLRWAMPPFFWSDQYDVGLEYRGWADPRSSRLVIRGTPLQGPWQAFWLDDDCRVNAAMHVNSWDDADAVKHLVVERIEVDAEALGDARRPLAP